MMPRTYSFTRDEILAELAKRGVDPAKAMSTGFDAAATSAKYQDKLAQQRAASDMARLDRGAGIEQEAYANEATADQAADVLRRAPTGIAADQRIWLGKALGNGLTRALTLGMIPSKEETADLETVRRLGNTGTLGSVGQLKGPLSDRDVSFLKTLQYDAGASPMQNARVVDAQKWLAKRQAAYAAAQRTWTEKLGSPSALNPDGVSFDRWWGDYSAKRLPPPTYGRAPGAPKASPAANAPRVAKDPYPGIRQGQIVQQNGVSYRRQGDQFVPVT